MERFGGFNSSACCSIDLVSPMIDHMRDRPVLAANAQAVLASSFALKSRLRRYVAVSNATNSFLRTRPNVTNAHAMFTSIWVLKSLSCRSDAPANDAQTSLSD
eukprot:gnl/TRDRNA2_/TRDRNA2_175706_c13_seq2.p1 gnl/TRDRNA2_/TRDRNA2_175706_c13~~gnl/TRDRNA2_/TRDRNA2_175706_c13_seq2.p1  ORF type:complete len:103 (-),score=9.86 gnl/TRDRNA2_/TRDRNA2_175706_c13_seq2:207-515(-)